MKVLSLALVGLCGFAGTAMAACPTSPVPPWDNQFENNGTAAIASGGYAGTECRLDSTINAGAGGAAAAQVNWGNASTPNEARYRAQFIVKPDALASQALADSVSIYSALSSTGGDGVRFSVFGGAGGVHKLSYQVRYDDATGRRYKTGSVDLPNGETHVEFDLTVGATGSFKLWVQNNNEATPTVDLSGANAFDNSALGGINRANLGLIAPTLDYVAKFGGTAVGFDQYDSRRQTFIGY